MVDYEISEILITMLGDDGKDVRKNYFCKQLPLHKPTLQLEFHVGKYIFIP